MQTRFDDLSPKACLGILVALLFGLLLSITLATPTRIAATLPVAVAATAAPAVVPGGFGERISDTKLYRKITASVARGDPYYYAAVRDHRHHGFPLKPFVTVRLPTLAWISAAVGPTGAQITVLGLIALAVYAWLDVLGGLVFDRATRIAAFAVLALSSLLLINPITVVFHETWAGLLIAASIGLRRPARYSVSIGLGLAAVLFREMALPYLIMMAALAAYEQSWRETKGWCLAIVVAAVCFAAHAHAISGLLQPGDLRSQGWTGRGGWAFFISAATQTGLIGVLPAVLAPLLVPLSLFGWLAWKSPHSLRVSGLLLGYLVALMTFARPENSYWALLISPLLLAGLGLVPAGLATLTKRSGYAAHGLQPAR
jgi:hypothetical protein